MSCSKAGATRPASVTVVWQLAQSDRPVALAAPLPGPYRAPQMAAVWPPPPQFAAFSSKNHRKHPSFCGKRGERLATCPGNPAAALPPAPRVVKPSADHTDRL
jgi:hypothetical protein